MECVREAARHMGRPLDRPSFPRRLAQSLALVPRAHETAPGRKVSKSGRGSARAVLTRACTAMVMTPKRRIHLGIVPALHPQEEGRRASLPRETRGVLRRRRDSRPLASRTRGFMPGPFVSSLMFTPLSAHTATHCNCPVV